MTANRLELAKRVGLIAVVAAALALAACGRKGGLELPPDASVEGQPKAMEPAQAPDKVPERSFVLDGLL